MGYDREAMARRIRHEMVDRDIRTVTDLGEFLGVTTETASCWIKGEKGMSLDNACRVSDAFGWSLDQLVGRE